MPADELDRAGLGALLAELLHEADLGADGQVLEVSVHDAVAVEEDLAVVERLEEAVAVFGEEPEDARMRGGFMGLHESAAAAGERVELLLHLVESLVDRGVEGTGSPGLGRLAFDHELGP